MKEVRNDTVKAQAKVEHYENTEMELPRPEYAHMTQTDADIMYCVAGFISRRAKKLLLVLLVVFLGKISALEINIEVKTPENCRFFVDEIDRGDLVKPSDLPYVICSLVWNIHLNSEAKPLFLSSKMHRSIFLNILHGQEIESAQYVNIL